MTKKGQAIAKLSAVPLTRRNEDGVFSSRRMRRHAEKEKKKDEKSLKKKTGNMGKAMNNKQRKANAKKNKRPTLKKDKKPTTSTGKEIGNGDLIHSGEFNDEEGLIMYPEQIHEDFRGIAVQTTHKMVMSSLELFQQKKADGVDIAEQLVSIKKNLTQYGKQGIIDLDVQSKEWAEWCDDVLLYFAGRFVISGEAMPVCPTSMWNDFPTDHYEDEEAMADEGQSKTKFVRAPSPNMHILPVREGDRREVAIQGCAPPSEPTYNTGDVNDID